MMAELSILGVVLVYAVADWFAHAWLPCSCGRSRGLYFLPDHPRAGWMLFRSLINGTLALFFLYSGSSVAAISAFFAVFHGYAWWLHEKDNLKRRAKRLSEKVAFNAHGRLAVVSNVSPG